MTNAALPLLIVVSLLLLLWLTWKSPRSSDKLRESLFRNVGVRYRNLVGLVFGASAALLPLSGGIWTIRWAVWVFLIGLLATVLLLIAVRPIMEKEVDRFAWGLLVIINLGFGLGALLYQSREFWFWLWHQYLRIKEPHDLILESLFLLGIILGFFVVRNWAKEQKDFVSSLSAVLSGAFLATILGKLQEVPGLSAMKAFAFYALGFTMSGTFNLILAARLTANYTNKQSITSRAVLDFLYGSERAAIIDKYFLKNFKDDPDYARASLTAAMINYRELVGREFAERMEQRRLDRKKVREEYEGKGQNITTMWHGRRKLEPACAKLHEALEKRSKLQDAIDAMASLPEPHTKKEDAKLTDLEKKHNEAERTIEKLRDKCSTEQLHRWQELDEKLSRLKPSYYYELMAIELDDESSDENGKNAAADEDQEYVVMYRELDPTRDEPNKAGAATDKRDEKSTSVADTTALRQAGKSDRADANPATGVINEKMFRVGISARWQDTLEYITAPGEYRMPFKYNGSVSGLALLFRKTIVMDRDKKKRFRNAEFSEGITPGKIEQPRGLDEIDFLSYVALPIITRMGEPGENPVGIMTIDTKLFVTRSELGGEPVEGAEGVYRIRLQRSELTDFGANLYEQEDRCIEYMERLTKVITPVLELYSKCRVGAT